MSWTNLKAPNYNERSRVSWSWKFSLQLSEYYLLRVGSFICNPPPPHRLLRNSSIQSNESQGTLQKIIPPPSSGRKIYPSKKQTWNRTHAVFCSLFYTENYGMFLRNVGWLTSDYKALNSVAIAVRTSNRAQFWVDYQQRGPCNIWQRWLNGENCGPPHARSNWWKRWK
jgi:hypothetical protein